MSKGRMLTTTPLMGNRCSNFFCSQCSTWRADQQAEGAEWKGQRSQCSTAKDFTPQWHEQHPRQPGDVPPATRHNIAYAGFFFSWWWWWGRFIHLISKRIMNFMQVKITKKAIHGRSAIQANLVFCCGDMNDSEKIQPQIFGHKVFLVNPLSFNQQISYIPTFNWIQRQGVSVLLLIKLSAHPSPWTATVPSLLTNNLSSAQQFKLWISLQEEAVSMAW